MFKKSFVCFLILAAVTLLTGNGCASFRRIFSDPGAGPPRRSGEEKKQASPQKKKSGFQSRRYSRDPLDALFFTAPTKSENWSKNSNLTDEEKAALRHSLNPEDDTTRREIDKIYRANERKRKKRQDAIFGPNPFRN